MAVHVFETTAQKTYEWLKDLMKQLGWNNEERAYLALKGTLQALRDRLPVNVSAKLSAQLPMLVRGFYYEGWKPAITPVKVKTSQEFLDFVAAHFNNTTLAEDNVEEIVRSVFQLISNHVSAGEVNHLRQALPLPIAEFWPSSDHRETQEMGRSETKQVYRQQES
ncbi:DUF2267 domain-containing protein [Parachlamydia sp. AcF125]|uniref:DUF2267 domain-containing protein n=1 Tax=Parachlamydia sp. AcF125 TaxID=2795736 RepID=UPI001BCA59C0|nr:DUF2267 domain-containing protein [Parachlamydia sp. AcF125]MBS4168723.1 hypothetical protein [Parachlamydia sp. AcF125]